MDIITGIICTALVGYFVSKVEKIESKLNRLEDEILLMKVLLPKRRADTRIAD